MKMKLCKHPALFSLAIFIFSGCASFGRDFNEANIPKLQPGVTTEAQVIVLLGAEPTSRTFATDGSYVAVWQYVQAVVATTTANKMVYLQFDKNKIFQRMVSETLSN